MIVLAIIFIRLEKSPREEVADQLVACRGEMDLVGLGQACLAPLLHRAQTTHHLELVPHSTACLFGKAIEDLPSQQAIGIHIVATARHLDITIVVGDKYNGTVGVDASHRVDQGKVVASESSGVEVGRHSIVDTDAEDNRVGMQQTQVAHKVGTAQIVGYRSSIDPYAVIAEAGVLITEIYP